MFGINFTGSNALTTKILRAIILDICMSPLLISNREIITTNIINTFNKNEFKASKSYPLEFNKFLLLEISTCFLLRVVKVLKKIE